MGELFAWLISFFILIALLVIIVYQADKAAIKGMLVNRVGDFRVTEYLKSRSQFSFFPLDREERWRNELCSLELLSEQLNVAVLMCLADLEFDYINPYDSASRINKVMIPEFFTQGGLCLFFLVAGHWFMALLCVPYLYYNVKTYMDNQHLVDVTEIFNLLNWEKKKRLFKLAYLIFLLFLSLFWMIWTALEDDEDF